MSAESEDIARLGEAYVFLFLLLVVPLLFRSQSYSLADFLFLLLVVPLLFRSQSYSLTDFLFLLVVPLLSRPQS